MNNNKPLKVFICAVLVYSIGIENVFANQEKSQPEESYLNLSEKLVKLRGEVSDLSNELQQLRDEHKLEMRGLITQKNTINANIKQEDLALVRLKDDLLKNKLLIKEIGADKETVKDALLIEIEKLKSYVATGLPFKVGDRLNTIESYQKNLKSDVLSSHKAVNTLWSMVEDELKLSRNNAIYRQSVSINNKEYLAHVAKIGMVLMYFKIGDDASDDKFGYFKKSGNNWDAVLTEDSADISQIKKLFDSLEKQIRVGYFELPNIL